MRHMRWTVAILSAAACTAQPKEAVVDSGTSPAQATDSPAATNSNTATPGLKAAGTAPAIPVFSGAGPVMSLALDASPGLCLSLGDVNAPANKATLVMRSCSTDALQHWVLTNGVLQHSQGTCLSYESNSDSATLQACNGNLGLQQLLWDGGAFTLLGVDPPRVLSVLHKSPPEESVIAFTPLNANAPPHIWQLGRHTGEGNFPVHGVTAAVLESNNLCLSSTGAGGGVSYAACTQNDPMQAWYLTASGLVQNEGANQCLAINGNAAVLADCKIGPSTFWGIEAGVLYNANSTCLDNVPQGGTPFPSIRLTPCNFTTSRHFAFGLLDGPPLLTP